MDSLSVSGRQFVYRLLGCHAPNGFRVSCTVSTVSFDFAFHLNSCTMMASVVYAFTKFSTRAFVASVITLFCKKLQQ